MMCIPAVSGSLPLLIPYPFMSLSPLSPLPLPPSSSLPPLSPLSPPSLLPPLPSHLLHTSTHGDDTLIKIYTYTHTHTVHIIRLELYKR